VDVSENGIGAPGYNNAWELEIPKNGNIGFEPINFQISLERPSYPSINLAEGDFQFTDALGGNLYAAVHIGNFGGTPGVGGDGSITVGALPTTGIVPEPGTLMLLGAGLLGVWAVRRRK